MAAPASALKPCLHPDRGALCWALKAVRPPCSTDMLESVSKAGSTMAARWVQVSSTKAWKAGSWVSRACKPLLTTKSASSSSSTCRPQQL